MKIVVSFLLFGTIIPTIELSRNKTGGMSTKIAFVTDT